jgi:hypothetical protein
MAICPFKLIGEKVGGTEYIIVPSIQVDRDVFSKPLFVIFHLYFDSKAAS